MRAEYSKKIKELGGVETAEVSYSTEQALVNFDSEKITGQKVIETVNSLGYKAF